MPLIPLAWMHEMGLNSGVPLAALSKVHEVPENLGVLYQQYQQGEKAAKSVLHKDYIHDSRYFWERWTNDQERTRFYPNRNQP